MALSEEEVAAFEDYFYHITAARGSGEHALKYILKFRAWAHNPLEGQLQHLKVFGCKSCGFVTAMIPGLCQSCLMRMCVLARSVCACC